MNLIDETIKNIRPPDKESMKQAALRQAQLTKPRGSLGMLEDLSIQIAGIMRRPLPEINHKVILTMAADHGVAGEGVSLYPREVTRQMVLNFLNGGAAINVLGRLVGARLTVVDMGVQGGLDPHEGLVCKMVDFGTASMLQGPAMTRAQAMDSITGGIEVVRSELEKGMDIVGVGEMGIGNSTAASAIISAVTGKPPSSVTGRGTGIGDDRLKLKIDVISRALEINHPDKGDALDVLSRVGGFEIGGMAGAMLAAAAAGCARGHRRTDLRLGRSHRRRSLSTHQGLPDCLASLGRARPCRLPQTSRSEAAGRPQSQAGRGHRRRPGHLSL